MSRPDKTPQEPLILEIDGAHLPEAPTPAEAPPPAEPELIESVEHTAGARAIAAAGARRGGFGLGRMLLSALGALILLWLGVALTEFVAGLLASYGWLGWLALGLAGLTVLLLVAICLREIAALARLGRIEKVRDLAIEAMETGATGAGPPENR